MKRISIITLGLVGPLFSLVLLSQSASAQVLCSDLANGTDSCPAITGGTRCATYGVARSCGTAASEVDLEQNTQLNCGSCTFSCIGGFADCDNDIQGNGCETESRAGDACTTSNGRPGTFSNACGTTCNATPRPAITLAPFAPDTDTTTVPSIWVNKTEGGNLVQLQEDGADRLVLEPNGSLKIIGRSAIDGGDVYLNSGKSIRVDDAGDAKLNIGNYGGGSFTLNVGGNIQGNFVASDGSACAAGEVLTRSGDGGWICGRGGVYTAGDDIDITEENEISVESSADFEDVSVTRDLTVNGILRVTPTATGGVGDIYINNGNRIFINRPAGQALSANASLEISGPTGDPNTHVSTIINAPLETQIAELRLRHGAAGSPLERWALSLRPETDTSDPNLEFWRYFDGRWMGAPLRLLYADGSVDISRQLTVAGQYVNPETIGGAIDCPVLGGRGLGRIAPVVWVDVNGNGSDDAQECFVGHSEGTSVFGGDLVVRGGMAKIWGGLQIGRGTRNNPLSVPQAEEGSVGIERHLTVGGRYEGPGADGRCTPGTIFINRDLDNPAVIDSEECYRVSATTPSFAVVGGGLAVVGGQLVYGDLDVTKHVTIGPEARLLNTQNAQLSDYLLIRNMDIDDPSPEPQYALRILDEANNNWFTVQKSSNRASTEGAPGITVSTIGGFFADRVNAANGINTDRLVAEFATLDNLVVNNRTVTPVSLQSAVDIGGANFRLPGTASDSAVLRITARYADLAGDSSLNTQRLLSLRTANDSGTISEEIYVDRDGVLTLTNDSDAGRPINFLNGGAIQIKNSSIVSGSIRKTEMHIDANEIASNRGLYLQWDPVGDSILRDQGESNVTYLGGPLHVRQNSDSSTGMEVINASAQLRMRRLDPQDFDNSSKGALVLITVGQTCNTVCSNHGLTCSNGISRTGGDWSYDTCTSDGGTHECWCT